MQADGPPWPRAISHSAQLGKVSRATQSGLHPSTWPRRIIRGGASSTSPQTKNKMGKVELATPTFKAPDRFGVCRMSIIVLRVLPNPLPLGEGAWPSVCGLIPSPEKVAEGRMRVNARIFTKRLILGFRPECPIPRGRGGRRLVSAVGRCVCKPTLGARSRTGAAAWLDNRWP